MRTLEKNKVDMWYVIPNSSTPVIDDDGYETGEIEMGYSTPIKIRIPLYPTTGEVMESTFGTDSDIDMVSVTNIELDKDTLLFFIQPTEKYNTTFDYKIDKILKSLNSYQYGLKGRI